MDGESVEGLRQIDTIGVTIGGTKYRPILVCAQDVIAGSGEDFLLLVHVRLADELQKHGKWTDVVRRTWDTIGTYRRAKATGQEDIVLTIK